MSVGSHMLVTKAKWLLIVVYEALGWFEVAACMGLTLPLPPVIFHFSISPSLFFSLHMCSTKPLCHCFANHGIPSYSHFTQDKQSPGFCYMQLHVICGWVLKGSLGATGEFCMNATLLWRKIKSTHGRFSTCGCWEDPKRHLYSHGVPKFAGGWE